MRGMLHRVRFLELMNFKILANRQNVRVNEGSENSLLRMKKVYPPIVWLNCDSPNMLQSPIQRLHGVT